MEKDKNTNKRNYQKELERTISKLSQSDPPTLLIHSCCAPCSSYVLEYLSNHFCITVLYYNPNISPREEYEERAAEVERLIKELPAKYPIRFIAGEYTPQDFYKTIKGHESDPEGGGRCRLCFTLRLTEAARLAAEGHYDYFTTSLSISPLKDAVLLNTLGEQIAESFGVPYLTSDFKKSNGYKRSLELSGQYNLYRQNYCGCQYSKQTK